MTAAVKELEFNSNYDIQALDNMVDVDGWIVFENTEICKVCKYTVHDEVEENLALQMALALLVM